MTFSRDPRDTTAVRRLARLQAHLCAPSIFSVNAASSGIALEVSGTPNPLAIESNLVANLASSSKDSGQPQDFQGSSPERLFAKLSKRLPGTSDSCLQLASPVKDTEKYPEGWRDTFCELHKALIDGSSHVLFAKWQRKYGDAGLASNLVVPYLLHGRSGDEGPRKDPVITYEVIIGDPEDARRIARVHLKKQPNFNVFFFGSIISTRDNDLWRTQRDELTPAFLPRASLEQIFNISSDRAKFCADRLAELAQGGTQTVDMNDFCLNETQAQLQLALFGESEEFMESTNEQFRKAMSGQVPPNSVRKFCRKVVERVDRPEVSCPALSDDVKAGKCPVAHGPLSAMLRDLKNKQSEDPRITPKVMEGNALILEFAGHDTTGHTLSWLLLELAHHPDIQKRLQREVDAWFNHLKGRAPVYDDLQKLPFMTRCITETLRLYPAVANGTFRELVRDEKIKGPDGKEVNLKKGTLVRIINWSRHRNPDLWGVDVNEFNPDRAFTEEELWHGHALRAYNPASGRFSPFMHPPRDCIGKNFAQMEARLILANLLQRFSFEMTPEFKTKFDPTTYTGLNYGTMGPQDLTAPEYVYGFPGFSIAKKRPVGLPMKVVPRKLTM